MIFPTNPIKHTHLILLVFITQQLWSQDASPCANLTDPIISDYDPTAGDDPCCGQTFDFMFYDLSGPPFYANGNNTPTYTYFGNFILPGNNNLWFTPPYQFGSWQELADIMTAVSHQHGHTEADFDYFQLNGVWGIGDVAIPDFDFIGLGQNIYGFYKVKPDYYSEICPVTEPDINNLFDPNAQVENMTIFNGTAGTFTTNDLMAGGGIDNGPSAQNIGAIMNAIVASGALEIGAGCFNLNCIDLVSLAGSVAEPEIADQLLAEIDQQELQQLQDGLTQTLSNINLTQLLNETLGWDIPDEDCPPGQSIVATYPFNPFSGGGSTKSKKEGSGYEKMMNGADEADQDYFSGYVPGIGANGPGSMQPSPSAMENIKQVNGGVNLYNGSQSTNIPLYNLVANDLSLPISLSSSNNGLKVDDLGSLVGQNWNLNAGGTITRVVKGLPDEFNGTTTGVGVGRNYKITPRLEFPSNVGLAFEFPNSENIGCLNDFEYNFFKQKIKDQFHKDISFGQGPVIGEAIKLLVGWTPLRPNLINFTLRIPIYKFPPFPGDPIITVYLDFGFNAGVTLNQTLGPVNYNEQGLGFLHLDDQQTLSNIGVNNNAWPNGDPIHISPLNSVNQREALEAVHAQKWIEDAAFLNDQIGNFQNWVDAIKAEIDGGYTYNSRKLDSEPDEFYFNVSGYSGKFYLTPEGEPIVFPCFDGLEIEVGYHTDVNSNTHISSFTVHTPEGMEYMYGSNSLSAAVDITRNTNYYLPNFYTYPEYGTSRSSFDKAQIDVAKIPYQPFIGPRKFLTFGNTYERNYKVMESPEFTSAWHLVSIKSKLTQEEVYLEYESRELTYYPNKNYSHTCPNFGQGHSNYLWTNPNDDLNGNHLIGTKWENGRAEFSYSVTETNLSRWHLTRMGTNRGESARFYYDIDREAIVGDKACNKIEIYRNGSLYKGWELIYGSSEIVESVADCDTETSDPTDSPISASEELKFNLGEIYDLKWFEYDRYFFINFRIGCLRFPIRIPFPFTASVDHFDHRTHLSEYGSLMEVKALANFNGDYYDEQREIAIFNAEKKRIFLTEIKEIDRNGALHDFVISVSYFNKDGLPKRYSVNQDLFGYHSDNSVSGSPLPRLKYTSILNTQIDAPEKQFGFFNVDAPFGMHLGQSEPTDWPRVMDGALHRIAFASGGSIYYEYVPNKLPDGTEAAGIAVKALTEDPGDTPAKKTEYRYGEPTVVNSPIRIYQNSRNLFYKGYEQRVVSTSKPQNELFLNKNGHVGYGSVSESWKGQGHISHYFTTPDNFSNILPVQLSLPGYSSYRQTKRTADFEPLCPIFGIPNPPSQLNLPACSEFDPTSINVNTEIPPAIRLPVNMAINPWELGLEYMSKMINADGTLRKQLETTYSIYHKCENIVRCLPYEYNFFTSVQYQNNYPGTHSDNYKYQLLLNQQPFGNSDLDHFIDFLIGWVLGSVLPHPFKEINRDYFVSDRTYIPTNVRTSSIDVSITYPDGTTNNVPIAYTYSYANDQARHIPSIENVQYPDGNNLQTLNYFKDEPEAIHFDGIALDYLSQIEYAPPLLSKTKLNGTLIKSDYTSLTMDNGRIVPWANYTVRNGVEVIAGYFDQWEANSGKPEQYHIAKHEASPTMPPPNPQNDFFSPIGFSWNDQLQLLSRDYESFSVTNAYSSLFELETTIDVDGIVSNFSYDSRGRLSNTETLNGKNLTSYTYSISPGDNYVRSELSFADNEAPNQIMTQFSDGFGKPLRTIRDNDGALVSQALYDHMFRQVGSYNITSGMTVTSYEGSPMPLKTTITDAVGNSTSSSVAASQSYYEVTKVTDPNGHQSENHTDALGRTRLSESGEGGQTVYSFDAISRLSTINNPIGEQYQYTYNAFDKPITKKVPGSGIHEMWYDERFRLAASKDANGDALVYEYDNIDRLLNVYLYENNSVSFDPSGIVSTQSLSAYFNPANSVLTNTYVQNHTWLNSSVERIFSPNGNSTKTTTNTNIDDIGRVWESVQIYQGGIITQSNSHIDAGLIKDWSRNILGPEQVSISQQFNFDDVLRPTQATLTLNGNGPVVLSKVGYNAQDLVGYKLLGESNGEFLQKVDYAYDGAGKLLRINSIGEMECFEGEEYCEMTTTFTVPFLLPFNACPWVVHHIEVDGQFYSLLNVIILGQPNAAAELETALEDALDYFGLFGDAEVISYYVGQNIVFEVTISNTNATSIRLWSEECVLATFELGDCCTSEVPGGGSPPNAESPNDDLFFEEITYDALDISRIDYASNCIVGRMRNDFTYDADHRVKVMDNSMFVPERIDDRFSTTHAYDLAGNITSLTRNGFIKEHPILPDYFFYGQIDNLSYTYQNERLYSVSDGVSDPDAQPKGFMPVSSTFGYDANGNITSDAGKGLTIDYNVLNLPELITGADGTIKFDYSFSAEKLKMEVTGPDAETRQYMGGVEFKDGKTDSYQHSDGRVFVEPDGTTHFQYRIRDHLGNLAVLFEDKDGDGLLLSEDDTSDPALLEVLQRHFYYPFGHGLENHWDEPNDDNDRYQYNGKELHKALDLGWYAYGARYYDPAVGRFTGVDPIAGQFPHVTTYNYAENRPINGVDLYGLQWADFNLNAINEGLVGEGFEAQNGGIDKAEALDRYSKMATGAGIGAAIFVVGRGIFVGGRWILMNPVTAAETAPAVGGVIWGLGTDQDAPGFFDDGGRAIRHAGNSLLDKFESHRIPIEQAKRIKGGASHYYSPYDLIPGESVSKSQVLDLANEMRNSGFDENFPIEATQIYGSLYVLNGHHRLAAAKEAGIDVTVEIISNEDALRVYNFESVDEIVWRALELK